jgi:hypothetical protein
VKYQSKAYILEAEQYRKGLEDGVDFIKATDYPAITKAWYGNDVALDNTSRISIPYIYVDELDKVYLRPDDYVITKEDGKHVMLKNNFEANFEPVNPVSSEVKMTRDTISSYILIGGELNSEITVHGGTVEIKINNKGEIRNV